MDVTPFDEIEGDTFLTKKALCTLVTDFERKKDGEVVPRRRRVCGPKQKDDAKSAVGLKTLFVRPSSLSKVMEAEKEPGNCLDECASETFFLSAFQVRLQ